MDKNQAMWQGCFFKQGPKGGKGKVWRLGMSVSFARLIILFREGVIKLNDVFFKYGIYGNHDGILMIKSNKAVTSRCDAIDEEYRKYKGRPLTLQDAKDDLRIVYGGVGSRQEKRYEAERKYFHNRFLRVDHPLCESEYMSRFVFASLRAYPLEGDPLPDVDSYKAKLKEIMKALGEGKQGQRRLAELFIKFRTSHSISEAEASVLDKQQKEIFTAMWRVHWLWQWGSYERKLWPLGLTVSFARLVLLFKKGEITLDYVFEACGISPKHDSVASVRDKCKDIDDRYARCKTESELDPMKELREVYGEDEDWNYYVNKPRLSLKIKEALKAVPAGTAQPESH
ncbi:uncharacterized protein LOC113213763 isoform X1 [Frankliniella occidentalis]|uniref:Uncharacterized protein LOC113213763 isoform X1 n=1 Tax=Frankliniella occidentalis TaxID=133901 RepID=A0A9C6TW42_FRAOC|nr:uncharacterized protein LOC113213763 isoform X1 [Frankliniella occidentalis]XP_052121226.1 uncharacterized protein LOC113213763 isoform X1 [Frankliniella occidentalis]